MKPTPKNVRLFAAPFALFAAVAALPAQTLIHQWDFNSSPNTAVVGGTTLTLSGTNATMGTSAGVSGTAYDNSAGAAYGGSSYASTGSFSSSLTSVTQLSFTLWVKIDTTPVQFSRLIVIGPSGTADSGNSNSIGLLFNGSTGLQINASGQGNNSTGTYTPTTGVWTFLAGTINNTGGSSATVTFYAGTESTSVSQIGSTVSGTMFGPFNMTSGGNSTVLIGGRSSGGRQFDGLIDDVRIYTGVLDSTQVENVRLASIPEPSSYAALAGIGALALVAARRRRAAR
jgi:Concanavalin A-like lectin/glucanases superfamily/PEP-CTERM motif